MNPPRPSSPGRTGSGEPLFRFIDAQRAYTCPSGCCAACSGRPAERLLYAWRERPPSRREEPRGGRRVLTEKIRDVHERAAGGPTVIRECTPRVARPRDRLRRTEEGGEADARGGLAGLPAWGKRRRRTTRRDARARARRSGPRSRHRRELAAAAPDRLWMADVTYVRTDEGFSSTWPSSSTPAPASWSAGRCGLPPPHRTGSRRPGDGRLETETGRRVVIHRTPIADRSTRPCVVRQAARRGRHRAVDGPHRPRPGRRHGRRELRLSTLKAELVGRSPPLPYPRSGQGGDIFEYVEGFYNRRVRRHSSPGYLSPSDYETATMEVKVA